MLTSEIVARLVLQLSPQLAPAAWAGWATAAQGVHGEDHEVAGMLRPLLMHAGVTAGELGALGATDLQLKIASEEPDATPPWGEMCIVMRRHAQPGSVGGLSEEGASAAGHVATATPFEEVRCSPSARTLRTAQAWTSTPTIDDAFGLPPSRAEGAVGAHASFTAWRMSLDGPAAVYGVEVGRALQQLSSTRRTTLVVTHDGVPQAVLAGLGVALPAETRHDPLGHLEGIALTFEADRVTSVRRLGAPPVGLLDDRRA